MVIKSYPSINIYFVRSRHPYKIKQLKKHDYKNLKNMILTDIFVTRTLSSSHYFILSLKNKHMNFELNILCAQKCGPGF